MLTAWFALVALFFPVPFYAAHGAIPPDPNGPSFLGTRIEFLLLTLVLPGVAIFNHQPFYAAAAGLVVISDCKLFFDLSSAFAHHFWGDLPLLDQLIHKHLGLASDQLAGACRTCPGEPGGTRQDAGESPFGQLFPLHYQDLEESANDLEVPQQYISADDGITFLRRGRKMDEELRASVLLVDDEQDFLQVLKSRLQARGLEVTIASSGEQGVKEVEVGHQFDLIILDLAMPGMDGLETLRQIKSRQPDAEIVMLSGRGTIRNSIEAMKLGAVDFLEKPLELNKLLSKIGQAKKNRMLMIESKSIAEVEKIIQSKGW
jgi:CheY-like chemotaxis protein